ncbi:unnamed protein product [Lampetra planeri]
MIMIMSDTHDGADFGDVTDTPIMGDDIIGACVAASSPPPPPPPLCSRTARDVATRSALRRERVACDAAASAFNFAALREDATHGVPLAQVEAAAAPSPRMRQRARRGARSSTDSHHASSGAARRSGEDVGGEMREHDRPKSIAFLLASLRSPAMGWDARERTSGCDPVTRGGG